MGQKWSISIHKICQKVWSSYRQRWIFKNILWERILEIQIYSALRFKWITRWFTRRFERMPVSFHQINVPKVLWKWWYFLRSYRICSLARLLLCSCCLGSWWFEWTNDEANIDGGWASIYGTKANETSLCVGSAQDISWWKEKM